MSFINGTSSFAGLSDAALAPIQVSIRAMVRNMGGTPVPAVPERGTRLQLLIGVGLLGLALRRRRRATFALAMTA